MDDRADGAGDGIDAERRIRRPKLPRRPAADPPPRRPGQRRRRCSGTPPPGLRRDRRRTPHRGPRDVPLRAHAGDQEDGARHQLPQPRQMAGLGGADDSAHPGEGAGTAQPLREPIDDRRQALVQRLLRRGKVLQIGGAGVAGPHQGEDPRAGPRGRFHEGLQRVASEQRVGGEGVGAESRHRPPGRRRLTDERLGVGGGRAGTSPRLPSATTSRPASRAAEQTPSSAAQPAAPRRSKQASCGFTATQEPPASLDQLAAVVLDRGAGLRRRGLPARAPAASRRAGSGSRPRQIWLRRSS